MPGYGGTGGTMAPRGPERVGYGGPQVIRQTGQRITGGFNNRGVHGGLSWKPWTPSPIPSGAYNPIRDVELASSKLTGENTLANIGRQRTAAEQNYNLGIEGIKEGLAHTLGEDTRARSEDTEKRNEALQAIQRSFDNLKSQQEQQANTAGVFSGGALLQAASKRATNQGIQNAAEEANYNRALANLAANEQTSRETAERGEGKEGLGKQQMLEELGMKGTQAERNANQERLNTHLLMGREAAEAGYRAPGAPFRTFRGGPEGQYRVEQRGGRYLSVTPGGRVFQNRPVAGPVASAIGSRVAAAAPRAVRRRR
jgi:hypothetical protein